MRARDKDPRCSRPRKKHSPNCDCASIDDEKLIKDTESMLSIIDHPSHAFVEKLVAPLVTSDRKRVKALYRKHISMMDCHGKFPPPSVRCPWCFTGKRVPGKKLCKECGRTPKRRKVGKPRQIIEVGKPRSIDQMLKSLLKKTRAKYEEIAADIKATHELVQSSGKPAMTAQQESRSTSADFEAITTIERLGRMSRKPGESAFIMMETAGLDKRTPSRELYARLMKIRERMESRIAPKLVEIEGVWSDGSIRRKKWVECSTGVAILQLTGLTQKKDPKTGKTHSRAPMLVRVFHDGLLVREWDQKANKYNLELD